MISENLQYVAVEHTPQLRTGIPVFQKVNGKVKNGLTMGLARKFK